MNWEGDRCCMCEADLDQSGGVYVAGVGTVCFECDDAGLEVGFDQDDPAEGRSSNQ